MASIAHYIKEIGRGKDGARALTRAQALDLFGSVLDGAVSDLEIGAFCIAMRVKGETTDELAGFVDAALQRIALPMTMSVDAARPLVVIPSYNGARKLPMLLPLLVALLQRQGLQVLVHGTPVSADRARDRLTSSAVFAALAMNCYITIDDISPKIAKLLAVRRMIGLRNSAHSVVKLMNPVPHNSRVLLVTSYTHPEYAVSMNATLQAMQSNALLLRGAEGEAVADPRRSPLMTGLVRGKIVTYDDTQHGTLESVPDLPHALDLEATVTYIRQVLSDALPIPTSIALQVQRIQNLTFQL